MSKKKAKSLYTFLTDYFGTKDIELIKECIVEKFENDEPRFVVTLLKCPTDGDCSDKNKTTSSNAPRKTSSVKKDCPNTGSVGTTKRRSGRGSSK